MKVVWGFLPFIIHFTLVKMASIEAAMWGALLMGAVALARTLYQHRSIKIIEVGNIALFGALLVWTAIFAPAWTIGGQRLVVDLGLFVITAASIALGKPFTIQYAREQVPEARWKDAGFIRANRFISGAWVLAFAVLSGLDFLADRNAIGFNVLVALSFVALAAAVSFTIWYPAHIRKRYQAGAAPIEDSGK
jgi:intracellular septation protein A